MNSNKPYQIIFGKIGESSIGFIGVAQENEKIPFEIKRVYWTYFTPESIIRGRHAHYNLEQVLVAVAGRIILRTEMAGGNVQEFILDSPDKGVYLPPYCWHTMQYSHNAVQLCLANMPYLESDYIRDYDEFRKLNDTSKG